MNLSATTSDQISTRTSMQHTFNDCVLVDVDSKFYRNIDRTFFYKHNKRMEILLEDASVFTKSNATIYLK